MASKKQECSCAVCKQACQNKPGWFLPGEAEKLAKNMHLTLPELFEQHLMIDYWEDDEGEIFVLSPAIKGKQPGSMFPRNPKGECVFYKKGLCSVHSKGKPFECSDSMHSDDREKVRARHRDIAESWRDAKHQKKLRNLHGTSLVAGGRWTILDEIFG